jgi:hypothetical protein
MGAARNVSLMAASRREGAGGLLLHEDRRLTREGTTLDSRVQPEQHELPEQHILCG